MMAAEYADAVVLDPNAEATYFCLDVSVSIRNDSFYATWVCEDLTKAVAKVDTSVPTRWLLWGSDSKKMKNLDAVVAYLVGDDSLCGTKPECFVRHLPKTGTIDLHVYTDGQISECSVQSTRRMLAQHHGQLKIRTLVVNYVNKNLDSMNVGLSAIFDGHVLKMYRTRVAESESKVHQFDAAPLDKSVSHEDIVSQHLTLGKTEEEMTRGVHYLAQRFANADPATRREIRRVVREYGCAVTREHRTKVMTLEQEKELLTGLLARDWMAVRKPFVGHAVADSVKLVQAYVQKFLNETKNGGLIRVSAYAPLKFKSKVSAEDTDEKEDVLLDNIMYVGFGKKAVIVLPVGLPAPEQTHQRPPRQTPTQCALNFDAKINFDNTMELETLLQLREKPRWGIRAGAPNILDQLSGIVFKENELTSGAVSFGINPFTRQPLKCVLLVPASSESLPAERLAELDSWNAHMMSRFVRSGRSMPSVPLTLALVLEKVFESWKVDAMPREEDRAAARKLISVCREYVARMPTPLTFSVGVPVIVEGTFRTAATLACSVLQNAGDPKLPIGALTQFWSTVRSPEEAAQVWRALLPYTGLPSDLAFPKNMHRTLQALVEGFQYTKSARNIKLRMNKGRSYSMRMYSKRLDQLAREGCQPDRLRVEEKAFRADLFGVSESEPLLCVHGVDADQCRPMADQHPDVLCLRTCRPTLLKKGTMDMWYVGLPMDRTELAQQSLHKAMWQLVRKRTKGKWARHSEFPPQESVFRDFVNQRLRAMYLERGDKLINVLPTLPCDRLVQGVEMTYASYVDLLKQVPGLSRDQFVEALKEPREVCELGPCCKFIRDALTLEQRAWVGAHATHLQVAGNADLFTGKVSYRRG